MSDLKIRYSCQSCLHEWDDVYRDGELCPECFNRPVRGHTGDCVNHTDPGRCTCGIGIALAESMRRLEESSGGICASTGDRDSQNKYQGESDE